MADRIQIGEIATGYVYYNRPGASLADHNGDLKTCIHDVGAEAIPQADPAAVGATGIVEPMILHALWDGPIAGVIAVKVENCMLVRGWRAVRLPADEGERLDKLALPDLASALTPWIGAETPHGDIVRAWANLAAHPDTFKLASRAAHPGKDQLSLRVYTQGVAPPIAPRPVPGTPLKLDPKWPTRPLKPSDIAAAPPGSAILVVRIRGIGPSGGIGVVFNRLGPDLEVGPSVTDLAPDVAGATIGWLYAKHEGNWFIFAVPPGRWRITAAGFLNYCLGSPAFDLHAGEIVYAGTFDLAGDNLGPDLSLDPARAYLGGAATDRLRSAVYQNGSRGSCRGFGVIYALEIPGAPFEPGYAWGGALGGLKK